MKIYGETQCTKVYGISEVWNYQVNVWGKYIKKSRNGMEWLTSFFSVNLTLEGLLLCKFKKFEWFLALSKADKMST